MMSTNNHSNVSSGCASSETLPVAVTSLYFILFPVALCFNGVAAWVSLHLPSTSTFIVYLKNLVVADLLTTLSLLPSAASILPGAPLQLRVFGCRFFFVIFYSSLYASVLLMGLISLDRFFRIVRPRGKLLGQSVMFSVVMSAVVWIVIVAGTLIPTIVLTNQHPVSKQQDFCMSLKGPEGQMFHAVVTMFTNALFWAVSILIAFCYVCITMKVLESFRNSGSNNSQGKRKTKLRVFFILLEFFVCFVPLHLLRIPFAQHELFGSPSCSEAWLEQLYQLFLWLSSTNVCLDPLLYISLCREYRTKLVDMMRPLGTCVPFDRAKTSVGSGQTQES